MVSSHSALDGGLFQSELWKDFQKSLKKEIFETEDFWGVIHESPILGRYGEVTRGPIENSFKSESFSNSCKILAQKEHLSFLRIEPQYQSFLEKIKSTALNLQKASLDVQPKEILMLPLTSEAELFSQMKSKTRYNIRLAQKKGVTIKTLETSEEENQFLNLLGATAERKKIQFHSRSYFKKFIHFFGGEKGQTFIAVHDGRVLAGSTLVFFENTAYYVHGGSSDEGRNVMAPHLLQWEQIKYSLERGCTQYDFGGIQSETSVSKKDWTGITRFKRGFAPHASSIHFPGTYDIIFSSLRYNIYQFLIQIKKIV